MSHPLVKHCMREEYDVYCGRWNKKIPFKSKWANPFKIGVDGSREQVIQKYIDWLSNNQELLSQLHELKGKRLGCWCAPQDCHCDILATLANEY